MNRCSELRFVDYWYIMEVIILMMGEHNMNKPFVKNAILFGIPTIISAIGILMALDMFKKYNNLLIIFTFLLLIIFLSSLFYYSKQEKSNQDEINELKSTIITTEKVIGISAKTIGSIVKLLETWNIDINKIANDILKCGSANEKDWDCDKIYNDICVCCRDSIAEFTKSEEKTDISVSLVKYYHIDNIEYVKMVAHSSPQTAKPDIYDKELLLSECKYYFGKLIIDKNRSIKVLENNIKIQQYFYRPKPETNLGKYHQYIAIPIMCSKNKILGILQITTKYNYVIMDTEVELLKFCETHLTPFVDLLILTEKIEKGIFAKPENEGK